MSSAAIYNVSGGNSTSSYALTSTERIFEVFLSVQELYLHKVIDQLISTLESTYQIFHDDYLELAQAVFYSFLAFQIIALTLLRPRFIRSMRDDVMKSRGILNLVPESFFRNHQMAVEKVIKMMKY